MTRHDNFHSALVGWLKVLLPLIALGILSTLFLVARPVDPEGAIPFAEVDVGERVREPRLTRPTWAGVTEDGAALTIRAAEARPADATAGPRATDVVARIDAQDGGRTDITAATAAIDPGGEVMTLAGGVVSTTSTAYRITTPELTIRLDRTLAQSNGPVQGEGPAGRIAAGGMTVTADAARPGAHLLVFDKGVRLRYAPAATELTP